MSSSSLVRVRWFLVILLAAACGNPGDGGNNTSTPPVVTPGADSSVMTGSSYALAASFSDTSNDGPWNYEIAWGDDSRSQGSKNNPGPITGTHTYTTDGSYRVTIAVTNAGGETGTGSLTVTVKPPVLLLAGDIGDCLRDGDDQTGTLLNTMEGIVVPLGDNAYLNGTPDDYANCYQSTWGRHKARSRPVAGNHDYNCQPGQGLSGCDTPAAGYFGYFGSAAGNPATGYYSYELGSWFVIVLNSGTDRPVLMEAGSEQEQWLRSQLASHSQQCVLALMHHPRFSTTLNRSAITPHLAALWNALYEYGADLVVNGHDHNYERFAPQRPDGTADATYGIRQITVGTGGGETLYSLGPIPPGSNLEVRDNQTFGVLKLTLKNGGYDWRFTPVAGATFTDSGSATCHGRPM